MQHQPKVSIGLPVYNGENYLEEALASILAQTFTDFELIISDNASTDRTQDICQAYADYDPRIRSYRSEINRGAAWNFNRTYALARGEYFKWVAHDDLIQPTFIEKCVAVLDADPSVVLCFCHAQVIDANDELITTVEAELATGSPLIHERYRDLVLNWHGCLDVFGLIRSNALATTILIGNYAASDRVLLADLSLQGRFHNIPESLFISRVHSGQSSQVHLNSNKGKINHHSYTAWFDAAKSEKIIYPQWKLLFEYYRIVRQKSLPFLTRFWCQLYLVRWSLSCWRSLAIDLIIAAHRFLHLQSKRIRHAVASGNQTGKLPR